MVILALKISKEFEVTITVAMIQWFVSVVDGTYTSTVLIAKSLIFTSRFGCNFGYVVFSFLWLYVLIAKFNETEELANSGVLYLHEIWNKRVCGKIDAEFRYLQLISLRMHNTEIEFNACGYFSLNWRFFQMVTMSDRGKSS